MLKKTLILLILLLLLGICWKLPLIQKNISKYSVQTNPNQIVLENNIYKIQRQKYNSFNIEIHYPQIQTATFQCDIAQINSMIKDVATAVLDRSYADFVFTVEKEFNDLNNWIEYNVTYELLQSNTQYISIIFSVVAYNGGAYPYVGSHIVTIDISTNKFVYFDDLLCIEELENALINDNFNIYEGTYSELNEEDVHMPNVINDLIKTSKKMIKDEVKSQGYNAYSCQNIGIDERYFYIYLRSNIAFHDYFIIQIPQKTIQNEKQDILISDEVYNLKRDNCLQKNVNIKIQYPMLTDSLMDETKNYINTILKNAAFLDIAATYEDANGILDKIVEDYNQWIDIEIQYDILQADEECIQVIFNSVIIDNLEYKNNRYAITINVVTGQYRLNDLSKRSFRDTRKYPVGIQLTSSGKEMQICFRNI